MGWAYMDGYMDGWMRRLVNKMTGLKVTKWNGTDWFDMITSNGLGFLRWR